MSDRSQIEEFFLLYAPVQYTHSSTSHPLGVVERSPCHKARHKEEAAAELDDDDCAGSFTGFIEGSGRICGLKGKNKGEKYVG